MIERIKDVIRIVNNIMQMQIPISRNVHLDFEICNKKLKPSSISKRVIPLGSKILIGVNYFEINVMFQCRMLNHKRIELE